MKNMADLLGVKHRGWEIDEGNDQFGKAQDVRFKENKLEQGLGRGGLTLLRKAESTCNEHYEEVASMDMVIIDRKHINFFDNYIR